MDPQPNSIDNYLSGRADPVAAEPASAPNAIDKYLADDPNLHAPGVLEQATREGHDWQRLSWGLQQVGANPEDYKHLAQAADLNAAKRRVAGEGMTTGQAFRRSYLPFGGVADALGFTKGTNLGTSRVVGNKEYFDATERFKKGEATSDDVEAIATYERHAEIDKETKKNARVSGLWGDRTGDGFANKFGGRLLLELGSLGKVGGEAMLGTQALRPLAAGARALGGGTVAAAAGTAPAVPEAASTLRAAAGYAGGKLPVTAVTPSLYVPMMQQNNTANNRDPNDWRGLPSAFGYGYANMLVLGQLQKGLNGPLAISSFQKGVLGTAEMQGVDIAAGTADAFLPKAYKIKPTGEGNYGNLGDWLRARRAGDRDKAEDALRDASIQMLSFSAFAAMHGRESHATDLAQSYADTFAKLRDKGMGKAQAAERLTELHDKLERDLSADPYLTREKATDALANHADADLKDYAAKLASVFEPKARVPAATEPAPPQAPAPEPAKEAKPPEPPITDEGLKAATDASEKVAPPPEPPAAPAPAPAAAATPEARQPIETAARPAVAPAASPEARPAEPAVLPRQPEIVQQPKPGEAAAVTPPDGVNPHVDAAVRQVFGDRANVFGDAAGRIYSVDFGGGRFLAVTPDVARPGAKPGVNILFANAEHVRGELEDVPKSVTAGSASFARDLKSLAGELGRRGVSISYEAEKRRHEVYSRILADSGFTLTKSEKGAGDTFGAYTWEPGGAPVVRAGRRKASPPPPPPEVKSNEVQPAREAESTVAPKAEPKVEPPAPPPAPAAAAALAPPEPPPRAGARARPANTEEATNAAVREQWDSMDAADRRAAAADPASRKFFEDAGIDVAAGAKDAQRKERNQAGKASSVGATSGREAEAAFKQLAEDSGLSTSESQAARGVAAGWSLARIATQTGKSKQAVQQAGVRAVKKFAARALERMTAEADGDAERTDSVRRLAEEVQSLSADTKPATLERVIQALAGYDAAARVEAREARGVVEIDKEGRVKSGEAESYFGGLPFKLSLLDGVFGKAGAGQRTVWRRLLGLFFGNLPSEARAAKEQEMDARIAAYAFDVKNGVKDLESAVKRVTRVALEDLPKADVKKIDDLLRVDPSQTLAAAAAAGVHPDIAEVVKSMRTQVDSLSQALVATGAISGPLVATVQGNVGMYLNRQYQVFADPAWESKVDPAIVNRFKSWLTAELIGRGYGPVGADFVDAETKRLLRDGTAAENPIAFLRNSVLGAKDLSILKERHEVPPELRALWGEYENPVVNYANSVGKMAHLLASHQFLSRVAREGLGTFLFRDATVNDAGEYVHTFDTGKYAAFAPLEGLRTTKEIKAAFEDAFSDRVTSTAMKHYMKFVAMSKFLKTAASSPGQSRNFLSNVGIVVRSGLWQVGRLPAAFGAIFSDTPAAREYWRKLVTLGVVDSGVHYQDFKRTVEDAIGDHDKVVGKDGLVAVDNVFKRMVKGVAGVAGKMYQYGDNFWKVFAFEAEAGQYEKAGLPRADAEAKAARIVRDTMPTYSKIPEALQKLRRFPFAAPFISFQAEMVRTTKNTVKQMFEDFRDPRTRGIGARRLAGLTAAAALPFAVAAATRALFGVDADEEKAVRRFLPEWQKESQLVYTGRQANGQVEYLDLSKTDPHSYLSDGLLALFRAKDAKTGVANAADEWAKPFTQEELLVRPALDIARNRKEPGGTVYNPQDSLRQRALDVGRHALKPFEPGGYTALRRAYLAWTDQAEQKSGKTYERGPATLENFTGQRVEPLRVEAELENKAHGFAAQFKDADKIVQEMIQAKGVVTPDEIREARQRTEDGRKKALEEFRDDVLAAERLGVDRKKIARVLHDAGLSALEIGQLFTGVQAPYLPAFRGSETQRVRAGSVRKLAVPSPQP